MSAIAVPKGSLFDAVLKAVIIYDDFDSATRATSLLERVAVRADETMKWDIKPWRFDVLKQPTLAALTVAVAANADLIVLALRRTHSSQAELLNWLKNWAEHRRIKDAAVLALPPSEDWTPLTLWDELKTLAEGYGLILLDGHNTWNDGYAVFFGHHWRQRRQLTTPGRARVFAERAPVPPHWGINE